jgi:formiminotetrahydrofolate cyclodeaminase
MNYRKGFKKYLDDLGAKKPAPGGGSAVCLGFCMGVSLIEKAINYSLDKDSKLRVGRGKIKGKIYLDKLSKLKRVVYSYIDLDGQLFEKVMKERGERRLSLLKKSEALIIDLGKSCLDVFSLAKKVESGIKKSITSDFDIGLEFVKISLLGCVLNLDANTGIFGKKNKYKDIFRAKCL